jgi:release factor glutamine methyltransferase
MIYEPREDSEMLGVYVKKYAKGKVLEIGVGSGILMEIALANTKSVEGVDIDRKSVDFCREKGLSVRRGDLFTDIFRKFDLIIFNPPYLPQDENLSMKEHKDLFGGKKGWETISRFFDEVGDFLEEKGSVLVLFSSLTNKKKVDSIIRKKKFHFDELEEKSVGLMEKLYVYRCYR